MCCCFPLSRGRDQSEGDDAGVGQGDRGASLQRHRWVDPLIDSLWVKESKSLRRCSTHATSNPPNQTPVATTPVVSVLSWSVSSALPHCYVMGGLVGCGVSCQATARPPMVQRCRVGAEHVQAPPTPVSAPSKALKFRLDSWFLCRRLRVGGGGCGTPTLVCGGD